MFDKNDLTALQHTQKVVVLALLLYGLLSLSVTDNSQAKTLKTTQTTSNTQSRPKKETTLINIHESVPLIDTTAPTEKKALKKTDPDLKETPEKKVDPDHTQESHKAFSPALEANTPENAASSTPLPQQEQSRIETVENKNQYSPKRVNWLREHVGLTPLAYEAVPGILVLPIIRHSNDRVFSDLAMLFAREYAIQLKKMTPKTKIYNPALIQEDIHKRKLDALYEKVIHTYILAGAPDPVTTTYFSSLLEKEGQPISRIVFVDAELDTSHPSAAIGIIGRVKKLLTDATPSEIHYFVEARIQSFDVEKDELPLLWRHSWRRPIVHSKFFNITPSVYDGADSEQALATVSRNMCKELFLITPRSAYMAPVYETSVQGKLASPAP